MSSSIKVKIYNINPIGFKPTSIQVSEIKSNEFYCRFLDIKPINEFQAIGFKVSFLNNVESFSLCGKLTYEYVESIWSEYLKNQENPDTEFFLGKSKT